MQGDAGVPLVFGFYIARHRLLLDVDKHEGLPLAPGLLH